MSTVPPPARIAVIGAAWWSQGWHLPHIFRNPGAELAAIVERDARPQAAKFAGVELESREQLKQRYGVPVYESCEALIADVDVMARIDGVIVCTAHAVHAPMGLQFLAAQKHVLMEKPMTVCVQEAKMLSQAAARAAAEHNIAFLVNNTANFRQQCHAARDAVARGDVGEIHHVLCVMYSPLLELFDDPENHSWVKPSGTMVQEDGSGNGFGWGQLSHLMAWVLYVTRLHVEEVTAISHRSPNSGADITNAALARCANNASISLSGGTVWPGNQHARDAAGAPGKWFDIKIFGDKGVLCYQGDDKDASSGRLEIRPLDGSPARTQDGGFLMENCDADGDGPESLQEFIAACRGLPYRNGATHEVGYEAVRFLDAMYRSAATKQTVRAV